MDALEKAFETARDTSRLLITLATGTIAFTVVFSKELGGLQPTTGGESALLLASWFSLLGSSIVGVWTQLAIADVLEPKDRPEGYQPSIHRRKTTVPFRIQLLSFAVGVTFIVAYGTVKILCASQDTETEVAADVLDPWGLLVPRPKSVYNGPLFELGHDYPAHATPPDPAPWRAAIGNGRITTAKGYIAADMKVLLFDYANWNWP